jgi:peptidoglycan-associated lipoprotein
MARHYVWLAAVLAAGGVALGACATEEYVDKGDAAANARIDAASGEAQAALARAEAAHKLAEGNFRHAVLFVDDSVKFATGSSTLSGDAQAALAAFAEKVKADNRNVYIEIQGHADHVGSAASNHQLGHARADAVMDFLRDRGIPSYHMTATSFGEAHPTGRGHAEDRRVVLIVMN